MQGSNIKDLIDKAGNQGVFQLVEQAGLVELVTSVGGGVSVNVDGIAVLRIAKAESVYCDTSNALSEGKQL